MATAVSRAAVEAAIAPIEDPELPVRIIDLGMLDDVDVDGGRVVVRLLPTFLACPARWMVESEVRSAVEGVPGVTGCEVRWLPGGWAAENVTPEGKRALASVGLAMPGADGALICPFCGSQDVTETSGFGSAVCRSAAYCETCRTPVEVMKVKR